MYASLKLVHQLAMVISLAGFVIRGAAMLRDAPWLQGRIARTLPHIIDTVLLASALALVWMLDVSIVRTPWIVAKLTGLVVYIVLGTIALKRGRTKPVRAAAGLAAIAVFGYIVSVAITKDARGFFAWL
jgi:uncharacterized membrane protein SirB2